MSDLQPNIGASATFEAGPAENIAGKEHQLVFVRALDPMDDETMRYYALKGALETEALLERNTFRKEDDPTPPLVDRTLATAARYFAYMKGEVSA